MDEIVNEWVWIEVTSREKESGYVREGEREKEVGRKREGERKKEEREEEGER